MARVVTATLWVAVVGTILALVAVILLAVDLARTRPSAHTGTTGHTGGTGTVFLQSVSQLAPLVVHGPGSAAAWGDGSEGDQLFSGQTGLVLAADAQYGNLTLDGSILMTNGYRLFVSGTLTLAGGSILRCRGLNGEPNSTPGDRTEGGRSTPQGSLGGGAHGGAGIRVDPKNPSIADIQPAMGGTSARALWSRDTSLFAGARGFAGRGPGPAPVLFNATGGVWQGGEGGGVLSDPVRVQYEAVQALNPAFRPTVPLLSGGSGGGGGVGLGTWAGSGGGSGGGVIIVAARRLVTIPATGGVANCIDVSGGDAGAIVNDRNLLTGVGLAGSGGGGGGGLALIATESPPESYRHSLQVLVGGGLGVDERGKWVHAAPGRCVFWNDPTANASKANPHAHLIATAHHSQHLPLFNDDAKDCVMRFDQVETSLGIGWDMTSSSARIEVEGIYQVSTHYAITPPLAEGHALVAWIRVHSMLNSSSNSSRMRRMQPVGATPLGTAAFGSKLQYGSISAPIHLRAGDRVDVHLRHNSYDPIAIATPPEGPAARFSILLAQPLFGSS